MASAPVIQVLSKSDFTQQSLVALPDPYPLPPLPPSAVRVQTKVCALTVNNITYAKLGSIMGWWDAYPLPAGVPEEFGDPSKYGRTCVWGFARVLESNVDDLPVDSLVFGFLPIGTLPADLVVKPLAAQGHVAEVSPHRSKLIPIYNRYMTFRPEEVAGLSRDFMGWSALTRTLFLAPWGLNRFVFAWDRGNLVSPSSASSDTWTFEHANLAKSTVILLSGSSKTALCFAQQLRSARPKEFQPTKIVGVTSDATSRFTESTGLYDQVLRYEEPETGRLCASLDISSSGKIVLLDFGSRERAFQTWVHSLKGLGQEIVIVGVGSSEPKVLPLDALKQAAAERVALGSVRTNSSDIVDGAMEIMGEDKCWREFMAAWRDFVSGGAIPGVSLEWGSGMTDLSRVWGSLCTDGVRPEKGHVLEL